MEPKSLVGLILVNKINQKSRLIFDVILRDLVWTRGEGVGGRGGAQEVLFFAQRLILDKDIDG